MSKIRQHKVDMLKNYFPCYRVFKIRKWMSFQKSPFLFHTFFMNLNIWISMLMSPILLLGTYFASSDFTLSCSFLVRTSHSGLIVNFTHHKFNYLFQMKNERCFAHHRTLPYHLGFEFWNLKKLHRSPKRNPMSSQPKTTSWSKLPYTLQ